MKVRGVESGCPGDEGVSGDAVSPDRTFWFLFVARTKRNAPTAVASGGNLNPETSPIKRNYCR